MKTTQHIQDGNPRNDTRHGKVVIMPPAPDALGERGVYSVAKLLSR